jgi:hypothetical protein
MIPQLKDHLMTMPHRPPAWQPPLPRKRNPALIVLFVILGFCALLFVGCGALLVFSYHEVGKNPEANAPKKAYAINQPAKDGQFTFVVSKTDRTDHIGDSVTGTDAQGVFIVVTVRVTNHGSSAQMLDASDQHLIADGKTYDATNDLTSDAFLNNINPGNSVEAELAFDVPEGADPTQVVLHDSPFSNGVRVNLGEPAKPTDGRTA